LIEFNSILWLLHRVDVGDVADVSKVHADGSVYLQNIGYMVHTSVV
jgi:hypothetical protein